VRAVSPKLFSFLRGGRGAGDGGRGEARRCHYDEEDRGGAGRCADAAGGGAPSEMSHAGFIGTPGVFVEVVNTERALVCLLDPFDFELSLL